VPRAQKTMTIAALVVVIGVVIAGAATATTRYVISSLSQISPTVVKQLGPPSAAVVATGHVTPLGANARTAALGLRRAPAAVTGTVLLVNNGSSDVDVTCSIHLGSAQISPAVTVTVPAASSNPLGVGGSSANTVTIPLAASPKTTGTLAIVCNPASTSNTLVVDSTLAAFSADTVTFLTPKPAPTTSSSSSPSTSPSSSTSPTTSPTSSSSASATPTTSSSGSASPSSSSSSSCATAPLCP